MSIRKKGLQPENNAENSLSVARSEQMRRIRSTDTKPELLIRRRLFALGYRYRLHQKNLPGKPDLSFVSRRKVIFVHGCFWHRHEGCKKNRLPKSRLEYWLPKFQSNIERDRHVEEAILALGWEFLVVWECELKEIDEVMRRIQDFLDRPVHEKVNRPA